VFKRLHLDSDELALALVSWICALPLIALIVIPFFGFKVASATALALIFVFVILCLGTFRRRMFKGPDAQGSRLTD